MFRLSRKPLPYLKYCVTCEHVSLLSYNQIYPIPFGGLFCFGYILLSLFTSYHHSLVILIVIIYLHDLLHPSRISFRTNKDSGLLISELPWSSYEGVLKNGFFNVDGMNSHHNACHVKADYSGFIYHCSFVTKWKTS